MFKKIIRVILSFFAPKRRKSAKAEQRATATKEIRRIALCVDDLKIYKRRNPEVRCVRAKDFTDAYCFLLRMCDSRQVTYRRCGGYSCFSATLPGNEGRVELTDRCGRFDKRIVAEMRINVPSLSPNVSKIKFITTNNQ